jgi:hypothetical protein
VEPEEPLSVTIPVVAELQSPAGAASLKVAEAVMQRTVVPEIEPAFGKGFTVTTAYALAVPQLLVTR